MKVSVTNLARFAARQGDLTRQFNPAVSSADGQEAHLKVQHNRCADYQAELALKGFFDGIELSGRTDGYDPRAKCIEEIKTCYGNAIRIPANQSSAHWAQAKLYAWLQSWRLNLTQITVAVIYYDLNKEREQRYEQQFDRVELDEFCHQLLRDYRSWMQQQRNRQQLLVAQLKAMVFPYPQMHHGQRIMSESVYKSIASSDTLLCEAPTGTGKTLASLFPALKAKGHNFTDKLYFLTPKQTGQQPAIDTLKQLTSSADLNQLRSLQLSAQERICLNDQVYCDAAVCPYAEGFYDKLKQVREQAALCTMLDIESLQSLGRKYQICPYYLSVEMARWADVIIADVNYYFDSSALLWSLCAENNWRVSALIDESHNLVSRSRDMYSAELDRQALLDVKPLARGKVKAALNRINRLWLNRYTYQSDYQTLENIEESLLLHMQDFIRQTTLLLQQEVDNQLPPALLIQFYFNVMRFYELLSNRSCDGSDEDAILDWQPGHRRRGRLAIRNVIPARQLQKRFEQLQGCVLFSATLQPFDYFQSLLGVPQAKLQSVPSPFSSQQLAVGWHPSLAMTYQHREHAIQPICDIILKRLRHSPGNAIVFLPSYAFMQQLLEVLAAQINKNEVKVIAQQTGMDQHQRQAFINHFYNHNNVLAFAVLGGIFAEGIDLTGDALRGVFIATLGLPQLNPVNRAFEQRMQQRFGRGYDYTYVYPGLQKVVQAAGRVIRTVNDTGYLELLDQRFCRPDIQRLFPRWWTQHN